MIHTRLYSLQAFALILMSVAGALQADDVTAPNPGFVGKALQPTARANVEKVEPIAGMDVVFFEGGLDQNIRDGIVMVVTRDDETVGRVIMVETDAHHSAGLIIQLFDGQVIRSGDAAKIQTTRTLL